MSDLADAIRAAARQVSDLPPVLTSRRYAWMRRPERNRLWNERAVDHMAKVKTGYFMRERSGRFSPSGLAKCPRRQMFSFMGIVEENADSPELGEMAEGGKATHLDWQGDGLTEGYLLDAEVWVYEPSLLTGGSLDGIVHDGSIFELKSVTGVNFSKVVDTEVRLAWRLQLAIYFLLGESSGINHHDLASLVVTTRDFGRFREIRLRRSSKDERMALEIVTNLYRHHEQGTLPAMLEDCVSRKGITYEQCPYKAVCPLMTTSRPELDPS
jgi:hypothetical protein